MSAGLIVALDQPDLEAAEGLAKQLSGRVAALKVGLTLFTAHGPDAVRAIGAHAPVFCDLKLHDIPHQVGLAAAELTRMGVWMFTVHASGGSAMIRAAVAAAERGSPPPLVAAVTVLTSFSGPDVRDIGFEGDPATAVRRLGRLAVEAGAPALVCSPQELALLRADLGPELVMVTPGVRPAGSASGDQSRVTTPGEAARAGASYVVVGRPVTDAPDPVEAAGRIVEELLGNG